VIVGVSKDSVASHKKFAAKYDLRCYLLADPDGVILKTLGVQGATGLARRATFIVDSSGIVRYVYDNASARGHAAEVLAAVATL
jgi:peroxiredoxin Q/BCP